MDITQIASLDFETGSHVDLRKTGVARYAEDPTTRVICASAMVPFGPLIERQRMAYDSIVFFRPMIEWVRAGKPVSAWNAMFEWWIWNTVLPRQFPEIDWPELRIEQLIDTMAVAAYWGLPLKLETAAEALPHLGIKKDMDGHRLMMRMNKPRDRKADTWWHEDDPAKLQRLRDYCDGDVDTERGILGDLPSPPGYVWGLPQQERDVWEMDAHVSTWGVVLDQGLVFRMHEIADQEQTRLHLQMHTTTGGEVPSTNAAAKLIQWFNKETGSQINSLAKDKLAMILENRATLPEHVVTALELRQEAAKSSVAKLTAMENCVCADGRMRGLTQYYGAFRSGRWCLPYYAPVLVKLGDDVKTVPITDVTTDMLVWDGDEWVSHEGVVFSGNKSVIEHDGVVATKEHRVYINPHDSLTLGEAKDANTAIWQGNDPLHLQTDKSQRQLLRGSDRANRGRTMEGPSEDVSGGETLSPAFVSGHAEIRSRQLSSPDHTDNPGPTFCPSCGTILDRQTEPGIQQQRGGRDFFEELPQSCGTVAQGQPERGLAHGVSCVSNGADQSIERPPVHGQGSVDYSVGKGGSDAGGLGQIQTCSNGVGDTGPNRPLPEYQHDTESPHGRYDARAAPQGDRKGPRSDQAHARGQGGAQGRDFQVLGRIESRPGAVRCIHCEQAGQGTSCGVTSGQVPTFDIVNAGPRNRFMAWGRIVSNSGRLIQVQNYPRSAVKDQEGLVWYILECGDVDGFYPFFGVTPLTALSSALRGCLTVPEGKVFAAIDFSQIEARVTPWLAGFDAKLQLFRDGQDLYVVAAEKIFHRSDISGDQRQIGKVSELALAFGGGVGAFQSMAAVYGVKVPDMEADSIKQSWREANAPIVQYWYALEKAAKDAIRNPGQQFWAGEHTSFKVWQGHLLMLLPSGRFITYREPELVDDPDWGEQITYMDLDQYTRQWKRVKTYGGQLCNNATQGTARDVMASALLRTHRAGFKILASVHDEGLYELNDEQEFAHLHDEFAKVPAWTPGLPIAADGYVGKRFKKG